MRKITKNSAIFVVHLPKNAKSDYANILMDHLDFICNDDVYPLVTLGNEDIFKFKFLNCQNMTNEQIEELKKSVNEFSELLKSKE
ncbi:MAG: hypothetical protein K2J20_00055 [Bacilli bacterium]|nr:hypothetical protein [Bacilli bacterium]